MSWTKGKHQFVAATHIDHAHIHTHIIYNSTRIDAKHKYRNFLGSNFALRRASDRLCLENGLSIVENPKPSKTHYGKWLGDKKKPSFQDKLRLAIDAALSEKPKDYDAFLKLMQEAGYARWAQSFNLKQMASTLNFLTERKLLDYGTLCKKTDEVTVRFHELSGQIKAAEARMAEIAVMKKHIINYAKTREVYVAYRKAGYSKKFLAEHEADILLHKAAKKAFDEMGIKKLPTVKSLQTEYAALLSEKKKLYPEYSSTRQEMRDLQMAKANVAWLMGYDEKEQAQKREKEMEQTPKDSR